MTRRLLVMLMAAAASAQFWIAWRFQGFLTGDEVEILAEAFRVATGAEYALWDIRNRFVAHFVAAPAVWISGLFSGRPDPLVATVPYIALTTITIAVVHRLALEWSGDRRAAHVAALVFALHWMPLGFGGTTYPRVVAMACIATAALLVARGGGVSAHVLAGALAGLAVADRFSEVIFLVPLLIVARRRAVPVAAGALVSICLTVGLYDALTWGAPFASLRRFAEVTLVDVDFASRVKYQSPLWYLETLPRWCALTLLPVFWRVRRLEPWLFVVIPVALLSLVAHKELRYLLAVMPFLAVLAGMGVAAWWRSHRVVAVVLLTLSLAWNLYGIRFVTRRSMPAVAAARYFDRHPSLRTLAIGQLWAYGDKLYIGSDRRIIDIGTPPHSLAIALPQCDAAAVYESDITTQVNAELLRAGFQRTAVFAAPRARDVVVYEKVPASRGKE